MINYDSFSRCHLKDIFFAFHAGAKELKENKKAILGKIERAMMKAMCSKKVVDRKTTKEQMDMLGLGETIDRLATMNGVRWYGHVLSRDDDSVLRVALDLEGSGKRKDD